MSAIHDLDAYLVCVGGEIIGKAVEACSTRSLSMRRIHLSQLRSRLEEAMRRLTRAEAECRTAISEDMATDALVAEMGE